jgi:hypothetical protein
MDTNIGHHSYFNHSYSDSHQTHSLKMYQHIRIGCSLKINIFQFFAFIWRFFGVFPITLKRTLTQQNRYQVATLSTAVIVLVHVTVIISSWLKINVLDSTMPTEQVFDPKQRDNISEFFSNLSFVLYMCQVGNYFLAPFIFRHQYCKLVNTLLTVAEKLAAIRIHVKMDRGCTWKFVAFMVVLGMALLMDMISTITLYYSSTGHGPTLALFLYGFAGYFYSFISSVHIMFYLCTMKAYIDTVVRVVEQFGGD